MKTKRLLTIVGIVLLFALLSGRYYVMAEYRGCGYNPLKQVTAHECWCGDLEKGELYGYAGFRCGDCQAFCELYREGGLSYGTD